MTDKGRIIPDIVLNEILGEDWSDGMEAKEYTLKDELGPALPKVVFAEWDLSNGKLHDFTAWTNKYVFQLITGSLGDRYLIKLERNYEEN